MFYVICYDISDNRTRYRVVKALEGFGHRVQKSVFECPHLTEYQLIRLKNTLDALIDQCTDSVRYFRLCRSCVSQVEWSGQGTAPMTETCHVV